VLLYPNFGSSGPISKAWPWLMPSGRIKLMIVLNFRLIKNIEWAMINYTHVAGTKR
jgi:hypothetical protein